MGVENQVGSPRPFGVRAHVKSECLDRWHCHEDEEKRSRWGGRFSCRSCSLVVEEILSREFGTHI